MPPAQIKRAQVIVLFAFDVGYEIDLQLLETELLSTALQPTSGKKGAPLQEKLAASQPRILPMEDVPPLFSELGRTQATFYDFGSISIRFCWSLGHDVERIEELPQLSQRLDALDLEWQARERVIELTTKIKNAITHPRLSPLVDDYYLFIIEELTEPWSADELYKQHRAEFGQTLRFETAPLSLAQQEEATRSEDFLLQQRSCFTRLECRTDF